MAKPVIAIDIDDVLADYAAGFVDFSNQRWGTKLTIDDYDEHWMKVWKVDVQEVIRRADEMHDSNLTSNLGHREEARPVLEKLSKRYKLIVITSRRTQTKGDTLLWVASHYPMIDAKQIHFAGFWDTITEDAIHKTKGDLARDLGADYLIDDQLKHCIAAAEHGINTVLFGDYAWNQSSDLPAGIVRCKDWQAVKAYFDER